MVQPTATSVSVLPSRTNLTDNSSALRQQAAALKLRPAEPSAQQLREDRRAAESLQALSRVSSYLRGIQTLPVFGSSAVQKLCTAIGAYDEARATDHAIWVARGILLTRGGFTVASESLVSLASTTLPKEPAIEPLEALYRNLVRLFECDAFSKLSLFEMKRERFWQYPLRRVPRDGEPAPSAHKIGMSIADGFSSVRLNETTARRWAAYANVSEAATSWNFDACDAPLQKLLRQIDLQAGVWATYERDGLLLKATLRQLKKSLRSRKWACAKRVCNLAAVLKALGNKTEPRTDYVLPLGHGVYLSGSDVGYVETEFWLSSGSAEEILQEIGFTLDTYARASSIEQLPVTRRSDVARTLAPVRSLTARSARLMGKSVLYALAVVTVIPGMHLLENYMDRPTLSKAEKRRYWMNAGEYRAKNLFPREWEEALKQSRAAKPVPRPAAPPMQTVVPPISYTSLPPPA